MREDLKIKIVAIDSLLYKALSESFKDIKDVDIIMGDIFKVSCDTIVSPANSFGFMDGGLDLAISNILGWDIQRNLRERIQSKPNKELLVGEAIVIKTNDKNIQRVLCAPTMRVPMVLPSDSENVYLAMKAILGTADNDYDIKCIAIPGLGTGVGRMNPYKSARQMYYAYIDYINGFVPERWEEACDSRLRLI